MPRPVSVIAGDGIGPEVIGAARSVLDAACPRLRWHDVDLREPGALEQIRADTVALKGPVATGTTGQRSPNVAMRRDLDLFVQVRPARSWPGVGVSGVDLLVVRETTEDLYRGIEVHAGGDDAAELTTWLAARGHALPDGTAFSLKPTSAAAVRRAATFTFALARAQGRRRVTIVHKATVMRATDGLFLETARDVGSTQSELEVDDLQVDNLVSQLVRRPDAFDVLFMPNQYGDIVSDLAAGLTGGVGLAPGANHGDDLAVFEPVHGTAPRHAGARRANPLGAILSGVMLLRHIGEAEAAHRVEVAVAAVLAAGPRTYDLADDPGASVSTDVFTEAVVSRLP